MSSREVGEPRAYVHGYGEREAQRLMDQAESVSDLIHHDTEFPPDSRILEVACGVGAQTVAMAQRLPACRFVSFDKIPQSVGLAAERVRTAGLQEVHLLTADLFEAPFKPESFDVLFVSYLLEHLPDPLAALISRRAVGRDWSISNALLASSRASFRRPSSWRVRLKAFNRYELSGSIS